MSKYGEIYYGAGETYGQANRRPYSVQPFTATAVLYSQVDLAWTLPTSEVGDEYVALRLVRNQYAYSETSDDGVILLDVTSAYPASFSDTQNITSGNFAFYTIWLQLSDGEWISAGTTYVLVPKAHTSQTSADDEFYLSTHDKMMSYLPKVLTSNGSVTDTYDTESTLSKFLEGFSFTLDEILTYNDLLIPGVNGVYSNEAIVALQSMQLGLPLDTMGLTRSQKKLVRNAIYTYSRKGTTEGLETFCQDMTNYDTVVTTTPNILLSLQDSAFVGSVGRWEGVAGATITAETAVAVPTAGSSDLITNSVWTGKVVTNAVGGTIRLGYDSPITTGIPVTAGTEYSMTYYVKSATSTPGITSQFILWYDKYGLPVTDAQTATSVTVTSTWAKKTYTQTAPSGAVYAAFTIKFNAAGTYNLARFQFAPSSVTYYSEPRGAVITLNPEKYNYVQNPSFVSGGASWSTNNATATTPTSTLPYAPSGSTMLQLVTTGSAPLSSPYVAFSCVEGSFTPGNFYTFSIYVNTSAEETIGVDFYATDTTVGGPGTVEFKESFALSVGWQRIQVTAYIGTEFTAADTNFYVKIYGTSVDASVTLQFDCAQIEKGFTATNYFDGSLISLGAGWVGGNTNENDATSYLYPNRATRVSRLTGEVAKYLPLNTPYFVYTEFGLESSGVS
jgi:hypothetical protein